MIIGIDPHKMSHTANAVDPATNTTAASVRIDASLRGYREPMRWAKQFPDRRWAVGNAHGPGRHLAPEVRALPDVMGPAAFEAAFDAGAALDPVSGPSPRLTRSERVNQ